MSTVTETSHTSNQGTQRHSHTHTLSPFPLSAASVKAEALKCKRFMKFIYVPVKMPTATESRREREGGARQKGSVFGAGYHHIPINWQRLPSQFFVVAA